jgi:hypothetical protein
MAVLVIDPEAQISGHTGIPVHAAIASCSNMIYYYIERYLV